MSTHDVPGANPINNDVLALGCWAEHDDGTLIFVQAAEGGRVIYSVFDMAEDPILEYRDAMPEKGFKEKFSYGKDTTDLWTWHDKTPFPWDRVIKAGARSGQRVADVEEELNAAKRLARSRKLHGDEVEDDEYAHFEEVKRSKPARSIINRIQRAIGELRG